MKVKPANGLEGVLLRAGNGFQFRIYDDSLKEGFIDFDIMHCDLSITINDSDAYLWFSEDGSIDPYLDHSPATLGFHVEGELE